MIPQPTDLAIEDGHWVLGADTRITVEGDALAVAELLAASLRPATGLALEVEEDEGGRGDIALLLDPARGDLGDEGYALIVDRRSATISAATPAGLFYGTQTLRQLLPPESLSPALVSDVEWALPQVVITDSPRFPWRGFMLDVVRHFFDVDTVKRLIDAMALHKLNRLHLHLTDDQGWRLEVTGWPLLTEIGGSTQVGGGPGGFYTQAEYADLVAYAAARHVTVVPEIDLPGHCNAALASYGELNESGEPTELYTGVEVGFSSMWMGAEITETFVTDVLTEVAGLTPGPWLHVGGDETKVTATEDYVAFMQWVQGVIGSLDKTMIGWDEAGQVDLADPWVVQHWRHLDEVAQAVAGGAQVISSPAEHAYLDMMYDGNSEVGGFWAGFTTVQDAYEWDPVPQGLDEADVLGVEGALWTETIETPEHVDYLTWPRLAGLAELGWSSAGALDWEDHRVRLAHHGQRLEAAGIDFYRSDAMDW